MPAGIQVYSQTGDLLFDSNAHRLIKFVRDTTYLNWSVIPGTNNMVWFAPLIEINPKNSFILLNGVREAYPVVGGVRALTWGIAPPSNITLRIFRF